MKGRSSLFFLSNSSAGQNLVCIGTCRNNRAAQTCLADRLQVAQRPRIRLNSDGAEPPEEDLVLLIAQSVDRFQPRRIIGRALGQVYVARLEKRARTIGARLSIDVPVVVVDRIEWHKAFARSPRSGREVGIEHFLPGGCVNRGGLSQHAVEIEQAGANGFRQTKHVAISLAVAARIAANHEASGLVRQALHFRPCSKVRS